jgi:hypothetical protein
MDRARSVPVTILLQKWRGGDDAALGEIAQTVDRELHRLAASYLRRERRGHTLQPTALVNDGYGGWLVRGAARPRAALISWRLPRTTCGRSWSITRAATAANAGPVSR